jgi:predicted MFS family arabinose efflux permease
MLLFAISGALATAYTVQATASFVRRLPDSERAQGSGVLSSGLITAQGIGALLAGVVAEALSPATTVAAAGALGAACAVLIAIAWGRARHSDEPREGARVSSRVPVGHNGLPSDPAGSVG